MIEKLQLVYFIIGAVGLIIVGVMRVRARRHTRKVLSQCGRASDGEIYVTDPQTGTQHRLVDLLVKQIAGERPAGTPRQRKKGQRRARQALRA